MITKVDITDIPTSKGGRPFGAKSPRNQIIEFLATDWDACEADISNYMDAKSAAAAFCRTAKKYPVRVIKREAKLYIVKEDSING